MQRELLFRVSLPVEAERAYAWHENDSAFNRLRPAWDSTRMLSTEGIRNGGRAVIALRSPLGTLNWHAEHFNVQPGREFSDRQLRGPFRFWQHTHQFNAISAGSSELVDIVRYELPFSPLSDFFAGWFVRRQLRAMFAYRHRILSDDLSFWNSLREQRKMRILVTGSRGLIGRELVAFLRMGGHEVIGMSRSASANSVSAPTAQWDLVQPVPQNATPLLDGKALDAVIHLAGEGIAEKRWTSKQKQILYETRIRATENLINGLNTLGLRPKVFISASGVGYYGDSGDSILTENSPMGQGFLAGLARDWEAAAQKAETIFAARCVQVRLSTVLSAHGGALEKMLLPFKMGVGGRLGSGRQWMSWVALDDVLYAIAFLLSSDALSGPMNLVSPQPVTNEELTRTLSALLRRPAILPAPSFALRLALGEMADELLLCSQRAIPEALLAAGFVFRHASLSSALQHTLGKN